MQGDQIYQALNDFVLDKELRFEELEDFLAEPNFFEATGSVNSEYRHSTFLAYLLDPSASHGFRDTFLRRFIQRIVSNLTRDQTPISALELDIADLEDAEVWRERFNIDVLIVSEVGKLAVIIENKVGAANGNPLEMYISRVKDHYPDAKVISLYLTKSGQEAPHEDWIPVGYALVAEVIEEVLKVRRTSLGLGVAMMLEHYVEMVRRYLVEDSKIQKLAQDIYRKHKAALDFIFESRIDARFELFEFLQKLIPQTPSVHLIQSSKSYIRFVAGSWEGFQNFTSQISEPPTERIIFFVFRNNPTSLQLSLIVGPGDAVLREKLFKGALAKPQLFRTSSNKLYPKWTTIWSQAVLTKSDIEKMDIDQLKAKTEKEWSAFSSNKLAPLIEVIDDLLR